MSALVENIEQALEFVDAVRDFCQAQMQYAGDADAPGEADEWAEIAVNLDDAESGLRSHGLVDLVVR